MSKHCADPWFEYLEKDIKTIEGRLDKGYWSKLQVDDIVCLSNGQRFINKKITKIIRYETFETMLKSEGLSKVLPGINDIDTGIAIYHEIYPNCQGYNILAIHF